MMKQDLLYSLSVASGQVELAKSLAKKEDISLLEAIEILKLVAMRDQEASLEGISSTISSTSDRLVKQIEKFMPEKKK